METDRGGYLRADVNGEEVFWVDERILSSLSGRTDSDKSSETTTSKMQIVTFPDFPGGAEVFELIVRFCYSQGRATRITSTNACPLVLAAHSLETTDETSPVGKLAKQAEKFLAGMPSWSCSEILIALRQCRRNIAVAVSSGVFEKVLDSLMHRISSDCSMSPTSSSPESYGFRLSFDTRSTTSTKNSNGSLPKAWWLDDLVAFGAEALHMIVKSMVVHELDHGLISRFLLYYQRTNSSNASLEKKTELLELVIKLVYTLDRSSVSCKSLFEILRLSSLLALNQPSRSKLEKMIGQQLHQATLDNLLVPAQAGKEEGLYDVSLVLRLLKYFLDNGGRLSTTRLKIVGSLMDLYMAEVAPDPGLKPHTFSLLCTALPDRARDSYDAVHQAIDVYFQVHPELGEEEKMKICCAMNYEKITPETCKHLTQSPNFPSRTAVQALASQQTKLKSLLQETGHFDTCIGTPLSKPRTPMNDKGQQEIVLYAKKFPETTTENQKLKAQIQGMQWRVAELESNCKRMKAQLSSITKIGTSRHRALRSLPKLCS